MNRKPVAAAGLQVTREPDRFGALFARRHRRTRRGGAYQGLRTELAAALKDQKIA